MLTSDLDFDLPGDLIAQIPPSDRASARLLHYQRDRRAIAHRGFGELPALLRAGDLLVFNDSRVVPAKFLLVKPTGGKVEGLFLADEGQGVWRVLLRNLGGYRGTLRFMQDEVLTLEPVEHVVEGEYRVRVSGGGSAAEILARLGRMPLPPYIKRGKETDARDGMDVERYQTVYAKEAGSVAAPTAGLHFTAGVLEELKSRGVLSTSVTLEVGMGTFKPVMVERLEEHVMHRERYTISPEAAGALNLAKRERRRIIAVGTTATRVLESQGEEFLPVSAETGILIYPPYGWKHVSGLVTNFHLPKSTLIALVAAFVGVEAQRAIYAEAIARGYRFFSYGDSSFLE